MVGARTRETGGALCRPLSSVSVAVRGDNHGVSDPAARARRGPARVRRGRSRHDCRCRCRLSSTACWAARSAACFAASNVRGCDPRSSGRSSPVRPENVARKQVTFGACLLASSVATNGDSRSCIRRNLPASLGDHMRRRANAVGHHDNDAASVLGTVQGAALRSARACARPSGLDGACAQMIVGQLRDGLRMLFLSGRDVVLIDLLNGLGDRSRVFDPFRRRAFHPLVEVHFSRS